MVMIPHAATATIRPAFILLYARFFFPSFEERSKASVFLVYSLEKSGASAIKMTAPTVYGYVASIVLTFLYP